VEPKMKAIILTFVGWSNLKRYIWKQCGIKDIKN